MQVSQLNYSCGHEIQLDIPPLTSIDPLKSPLIVAILSPQNRHEFHKNCIDPWLLDHRLCPMCKMDILKYYGFVVGVESNRTAGRRTTPQSTVVVREFVVNVERSSGAGEGSGQNSNFHNADNGGNSAAAVASSSRDQGNSTIVVESDPSVIDSVPIIRSTRVTEV